DRRCDRRRDRSRDRGSFRSRYRIWNRETPGLLNELPKFAAAIDVDSLSTPAVKDEAIRDLIRRTGR
ncbi:MAG: hypothetical protein AAF236_16995, partial [Verrucomicrobiota bacterium]